MDVEGKYDRTAVQIRYVSNGGDSFGLSGATTSALSSSCANDFLIIAGGGNVDRYCGGSLNPTAGSSTSVL